MQTCRSSCLDWSLFSIRLSVNFIHSQPSLLSSSLPFEKTSQTKCATVPSPSLQPSTILHEKAVFSFKRVFFPRYLCPNLMLTRWPMALLSRNKMCFSFLCSKMHTAPWLKQSVMSVQILMCRRRLYLLQKREGIRLRSLGICHESSAHWVQMSTRTGRLSDMQLLHCFSHQREKMNPAACSQTACSHLECTENTPH